MKKPIIAGRISMYSFLLAKIKRQTGSKSCAFETPEVDLPKLPILFASKRK